MINLFNLIVYFVFVRAIILLIFSLFKVIQGGSKSQIP